MLRLFKVVLLFELALVTVDPVINALFGVVEAVFVVLAVDVVVDDDEEEALGGVNPPPPLIKLLLLPDCKFEFKLAAAARTAKLFN